MTTLLKVEMGGSWQTMIQRLKFLKKYLPEYEERSRYKERQKDSFHREINRDASTVDRDNRKVFDINEDQPFQAVEKPHKGKVPRTHYNEIYYTKKDLKERQWTDGLIKMFLGSPDDTRINKKYRRGPLICLYEKTRVHSVESQQEFIEIQQKRSKAAQKTVATKRKQMRQRLEEIEIEVPEMEWEILTRRVVNHYNWHRSRTDMPGADMDSNEEFLDRIRVNYLRHELTGYEKHLRSTAGKVGAKDAYLEIKVKVLDAIADAYPELDVECSRQARQAYENSL